MTSICLAYSFDDPASQCSNYCAKNCLHCPSHDALSKRLTYKYKKHCAITHKILAEIMKTKNNITLKDAIMLNSKYYTVMQKELFFRKKLHEECFLPEFRDVGHLGRIERLTKEMYTCDKILHELLKSAKLITDDNTEQNENVSAFIKDMVLTKTKEKPKKIKIQFSNITHEVQIQW